ncbi:MAG: V-type ATP synthase subunit I [candidate division WOR-3 bacterium]
MAVVSVQKVIVVVLKEIKEEFLSKLQRAGIIHITELKESTIKSPIAIEKLKEMIDQLGVYKKKNPLETFVNLKQQLTIKEFDEIGENFDLEEIWARFCENRKNQEEIQNRLKYLKEMVAILEPWRVLDYELKSLRDFKTVHSIPVVIPSRDKYQELLNNIKDIPHTIEEVSTVGQRIYALFYIQIEDLLRFRKRLLEGGIEIIEFPEFNEKPAALLERFKCEIETLKDKLTRLNQVEKRLAEDLFKLQVAYDRLYNEGKKFEIISNLPETTATINIIGWVKKKDLKKLTEIVKEFRFATFEQIEPAPDEKPPVAIENSWLTSAYEMLVRLYSLPESKELDPTPFIALFFPLFFALCLTDAIYGIFLSLFSLFLMRKVKGDRSLLWILFAGGITTIFTGSMVGGWAGDLFDLIGIKPLSDFKNRLMLFDPLTNPMPFFYISIGLGYIHVMMGVLIEVYDDLRNREYARAIFENLTWFILVLCIPLYFTVLKVGAIKLLILLAIVGIVIFSNRSGKVPLFDQILWSLNIFLILSLLTKFLPPFFKYFVLILCGLFVLRLKYTKKILARIAWGLYNLYGITSFVSNILSYVRLMALGMVTGGIAMTVNKIAWMVKDIPVIGLILTVLILIGGHSFNIVINSLGGFIHTMRLHYIEFFGRFYTGGGKSFKPFSLETKYVEIK